VSDFRRVGGSAVLGRARLAVALAIAILHSVPAPATRLGRPDARRDGNRPSGNRGVEHGHSANGGSGSGTVGTTTVAVTVPAGAFTGPTQLVITDATSSA